jgi:hypothetical protein
MWIQHKLYRNERIVGHDNSKLTYDSQSFLDSYKMLDHKIILQGNKYL